MSTPDRERERCDEAEDLRFAERLARSYRPEPMDPARALRFDAALREQIGRRGATPRWLPVLAGAAAALALVWLSAPDATPPPRAGGTLPAAAADPLTAGWEGDVLFADADPALDDETYLPDEYQAIAYAFLDGP